jgi:hypothetical protein
VRLRVGEFAHALDSALQPGLDLLFFMRGHLTYSNRLTYMFHAWLSG